MADVDKTISKVTAQQLMDAADTLEWTRTRMTEPEAKRIASVMRNAAAMLWHYTTAEPCVRGPSERGTET